MCVELLKKLKSQGSKKRSTSNMKGDGENTKKRKDTPPGILGSILIVICLLKIKKNIFYAQVALGLKKLISQHTLKHNWILLKGIYDIETMTYFLANFLNTYLYFLGLTSAKIFMMCLI